MKQALPILLALILLVILSVSAHPVLKCLFPRYVSASKQIRSMASQEQHAPASSLDKHLSKHLTLDSQWEKHRGAHDSRVDSKP